MITIVAENPDGQIDSVAVPIIFEETDVKPKKLIGVLYFIDNILIFSTMISCISKNNILSQFMYSLCIFHFLCIPEILKLKFRLYYFLLAMKIYMLFYTICTKLIVYAVIMCVSLTLQFSILLLQE